MSKEAMKLALEALSPWAGEDANHTEKYAAYQALRKALAEQPAQQEPVATLFGSLPVYDTSPPAQRKPWVGLTDEDVMSIVFNFDVSSLSLVAKAIEAKLKEKNT